MEDNEATIPVICDSERGRRRGRRMYWLAASIYGGGGRYWWRRQSMEEAVGTGGGGGDREREETGRKRASEVFPISGSGAFDQGEKTGWKE
jgi:hypothetical protein